MTPGEAPHYFSVANYANSPLWHLPDALVSFEGAGTGAMATAAVNPVTGAITAIDVMAGGSGYTTAPNVVISTAVATPTILAAATATVTAGSVTAVTVITSGSGYLTPGIRKFVDTLPGLDARCANNLGQYIPVAVPDTTTYPGSDYYEIARGPVPGEDAHRTCRRRCCAATCSSSTERRPGQPRAPWPTPNLDEND